MRYLSTAKDVSSYILNKCVENGHPISNLRLQKMLYVLQVSTLYFTNCKTMLFKDQFRASPLGPIIKSVFDKYRYHGGRIINAVDASGFICDNNELLSFINSGIDYLSTVAPYDLTRVTHAAESPWAKTYLNGYGYMAVINNDMIVNAARKAMNIAPYPPDDSSDFPRHIYLSDEDTEWLGKYLKDE